MKIEKRKEGKPVVVKEYMEYMEERLSKIFPVIMNQTQDHYVLFLR